MKIEHLAIWVNNLEIMKDFYTKYFHMNCSIKYTNENKNFSSYFLSFKGSSTRIELMHHPEIIEHINSEKKLTGLAHFAISVGSKEKVIELTRLLEGAKYEVASNPRTTGDGYFESVILDPESNQVEITE